jgi:iron complex transport system ATP-binding protein
VWLDDRPLQKFAARELAQRRAYLPQQARCEWPLPVWRLVGLGLTPTLPAWGDFSAADRERIDTVLRECDLLERREQSVATLSGGELARALFARTLVGDPQLLIVDEPLASLDPAHAHDALRRMRHLARVQDKVVIASLHDPNAVLGYCSRVLMLKGGRLIADGVPAEVMTAATLRTVYDVEARVIHHNGQSITTFGSP